MSDVIVIGGGVIGCGIAHALSLRGATVSLVEPRLIGHGASHASAGMLAPFTEGRHDLALQTLGARSLALYDALIERLAAEDLRVPYVRDGSIDVALDAKAADHLDGIAGSLVDDGVRCERLDGSRLKTLEPLVAPAAVAGLRIPDHGAVGVPELVTALWQSALLRGARHVEGRATRVTPIRSSLLRVETMREALDAPTVVVAAGCWAGELDLGVAPLPVRPVRGQLVVLKTDGVVPRHTIWGPECYLVPWSDGRILVGATVEQAGFDERPTVDGVRYLLNAAAALLPSLASAAFQEVRVGLRPGTADDRPIVGRSGSMEGLVYATGHYRNGVLLAPITAEAVADLVHGIALDPAWAPCDPERFGY